MRITVLCGGPSDERPISLISGNAVAEGLRSMGHDVFVSDVGPDNLGGLDHPADVIFPVLHGWFGESGELQEILESRVLAFVGSGARASKLGMDKAAAKMAWQKAGLPTPGWKLVDAGKAPALNGMLDKACVVKAVDSGSSIDVYLCKDRPAAVEALEKVLAKHRRALVEQYIKGPELTVGLLEEKALAPIRIVPHSEFFDYQAKYKANDTEHRFDTGLPDAIVQKCRKLAESANAIIGARDLGRIDIMLDEAHNPYLLEINTLPGFTPKSLLPEAARQAGIEFGPLVDRLARRALARKAAATSP